VENGCLREKKVLGKKLKHQNNHKAEKDYSISIISLGGSIFLDHIPLSTQLEFNYTAIG